MSTCFFSTEGINALKNNDITSKARSTMCDIDGSLGMPPRNHLGMM
jgi:hypothetical protein